MSFGFRMKNTYVFAIVCALAAALLMGTKTPVSKLLLDSTDPVMSSTLFSAGAAVGLLFVMFFARKTAVVDAACHLRKSDAPYLIAIILTSLAGALSFYFGLSLCASSNASLLNNFTVVSTALIAFLIFKENISKRLWIGIILTVLGCVALSAANLSSLQFSPGSLLIVLSCVFYGFNNNFMKKIAHRNPVEIVIVRCAGIALCSLCIAMALGSSLPDPAIVLLMLVCGFVFSGLVNIFIVYAQRYVGAAKTGAIIGISPLIGVLIAVLFLGESLSIIFIGSLVLVIPGMYFILTRNKEIVIEEEEEDISESPLFSSMRESSKDEARNYLISFGFLSVAVLYILVMFGYLGDPGAGMTPFSLSRHLYMCWLIVGIAQMLCGIILLLLRKRVLAAITFLFFGAVHILFYTSEGNLLIAITLTLSALFLGLVLLTANDRQKYVYSGIIVLNSGVSVFGFFAGSGVMRVVTAVLMCIAVVLSLYFAVASASQKYAFPLGKYLVANGHITFSRCGAVLGFLIFGSYILIWTIHSLVQTEPISEYARVCTGTGYGFILILTGLLLFFIGKKHFIGIVYLCSGLNIWLGTYVPNGYEAYTLPVLFMIIGVFAVLRNNSALLLALVLICTGLADIFYLVLDVYPELVTISILLEIFSLLLCLYQSFAVFSEKFKLPLF
ncbi:MAG TPA: DMT family transporter [Methanocorpusculum sp.]|nr:DMT family transporter [Methanocorpusculum sp.]